MDSFYLIFSSLFSVSHITNWLSTSACASLSPCIHSRAYTLMTGNEYLSVEPQVWRASSSSPASFIYQFGGLKSGLKYHHFLPVFFFHQLPPPPLPSPPPPTAASVCSAGRCPEDLPPVLPLLVGVTDQVCIWVSSPSSCRRPEGPCWRFEAP